MKRLFNALSKAKFNLRPATANARLTNISLISLLSNKSKMNFSDKNDSNSNIFEDLPDSNDNENEQQQKVNSETEDKKEEKNTIPLIYWSQPVLLYSQFIINNPNRNDLFFGLLLKYGKLKVIDEQNTLIEEICLFNEKDDNLRSKSKQDYVLGTKCEAVYKNLSSNVYEKGRFSVKRETGVHHFQNLLRDFYQKKS